MEEGLEWKEKENGGEIGIGKGAKLGSKATKMKEKIKQEEKQRRRNWSRKSREDGRRIGIGRATEDERRVAADGSKGTSQQIMKIKMEQQQQQQ